MTRLFSLPRAAAAAGVTVGVAAAGAAAGLAAERYVAGRSSRGNDLYADEPLGALRGQQRTVVTDDGVRLYVEVDDVDEPSASLVTVIFTHGYALSLDSWHFQRRDLRGKARLVFWDQRSHARSSAALDGGVTFERLARDLACVVDEVAPTGPVVLVGHSMGGMTVLALAALRRDLVGHRIAGVGLVATSHRELASPGGPAGRLAQLAVPGVAAAVDRQPALVERGRRASSDLGYVLARRYAFVGKGSPSLVRFTAAMNAATPLRAIVEFYTLFATNDHRGAVAELRRVPVLIVAAAGDRLTPVDHSRQLAGELPNADYVEVADAGHMVLLERHELVTEHLERLIHQSRPDRGSSRWQGGSSRWQGGSR